MTLAYTPILTATGIVNVKKSEPTKGQTLYQALDAFTAHLRETYTVNGELGDYGRRGALNALRFKDHHADMPYSALRQ